MQAEGRSITIEEAEVGRQKTVTAGLKQRIPALWERAQLAMLAQKRAFAEMAAVKLELAAAVTPSQVVDTLDELDRETNAILNPPKEAKTAAQVEQASAPAAEKFANAEPAAKGNEPSVEATPKSKKN